MRVRRQHTMIDFKTKEDRLKGYKKDHTTANVIVLISLLLLTTLGN